MMQYQRRLASITFRGTRCRVQDVARQRHSRVCRVERNRSGGYVDEMSHLLMLETHRLVMALSLTVIACERPGSAGRGDTAAAQLADSPATAARSPAPRPADSAAAVAAGKEPGTVPATPTPTVTPEKSIAAMRLHLQQCDTASVQVLQGKMTEHAKLLGDLLTTMEVEVQDVTSPAKNAWLASADTVENDLDKLALAQGEALRTAFRAHSNRVRRLLDEFRVLVPAKSG